MKQVWQGIKLVTLVHNIVRHKKVQIKNPK